MVAMKSSRGRRAPTVYCDTRLGRLLKAVRVDGIPLRSAVAMFEVPERTAHRVLKTEPVGRYARLVPLDYDPQEPLRGIGASSVPPGEDEPSNNAHVDAHGTRNS